MNGRARVLAAVLAASAICSSEAQPPVEDPAALVYRAQVEAANEETAEAVDESLRAENGAVEETPRKSEIALEAARDASAAKVTLSPEGDRWSLSFATPIQKGDPSAELATLRGGLADDFEASFAFHDQGFVPIDVSTIDVEATIERQEALCVAKNLTRTCDLDDIKRGLSPASARRAELDYESIVTTDGRIMPIPQVFSVQRWEIGAKVGRTERSYFSDSAEELDEDRLAASLGGSYGRLIGSFEWELDARWQRKYESQRTARRCEPVEGTVLERCKDLPLGRATEKDLFPISLEVRKWSGDAARVPWAVSPRLVYEVEEEVWGVSVPLYLVSDDDGNLSGGVAVDWQEGKDTVISVFVSAPLSRFF